MQPNIRVVVAQTGASDPHTRQGDSLTVTFQADRMINLEHQLPLAVQDDLRLAKTAFLGFEGMPQNTPAERERLRGMLQDVINQHYARGNLEYIEGVGFLHYRTAQHIHM